MPVLVAVVAHNGLYDTRETLGASRDSFEQVSTLLEEANKSLANATRQIEDFSGQMAILNDQVKGTTNAAKSSIEHTDRATLLFLACCVLGLAVSIILALWQTRYIFARYASRPSR